MGRYRVQRNRLGRSCAGLVAVGVAMTIPEAVELLNTFNAWRRGADIPMPEPRQIGVAIDLIIAEIEKL
jgi:hypothetical protein